MEPGADRPASPPRPPSRWGRARRACRVASAALCGGLAVLYMAGPDACAAITVFPVGIWLVPGLGLTALGAKGAGRRAVAALLVGWVAFLLALAEEPRSLARGLMRPPPLRTGELAVRVVTLNCNVGDRRAAEEVVALRPDIVLLQESPNRAEVEALAHRLFGPEGGFVHGVDASLIARGAVVPEDVPSALRGVAVRARVTLAPGRDVEVVSTRLRPAVFRVDLWSPDCWREQQENRRLRLAQVGALAAILPRDGLPIVLGGDFNAPQGDPALDPLGPLLRDAFTSAGRGWGDTITEALPALRIDAVWIGDAFRARSVRARATRHSDHRMVVADLALRAADR